MYRWAENLWTCQKMWAASPALSHQFSMAEMLAPTTHGSELRKSQPREMAPNGPQGEQIHSGCCFVHVAVKCMHVQNTTHYNKQHEIQVPPDKSNQKGACDTPNGRASVYDLTWSSVAVMHSNTDVPYFSVATLQVGLSCAPSREVFMPLPPPRAHISIHKASSRSATRLRVPCTR